jgi:DNA-binding PadR family transcriptional regulator
VTAHREESHVRRVYTCNEKKSRVLKELLDQINPRGRTNKRFQNSFKNDEISFSHETHALLSDKQQQQQQH